MGDLEICLGHSKNWMIGIRDIEITPKFQTHELRKITSLLSWLLFF